MEGKLRHNLDSMSQTDVKDSRTANRSSHQSEGFGFLSGLGKTSKSLALDCHCCAEFSGIFLSKFPFNLERSGGCDAVFSFMPGERDWVEDIFRIR
jgi:hypothetical protein